MAVLPCLTEASYSQGTTITFANFSYTPTCLKVAPGTTVTFSGDFASHPLAPSATRGTVAGNPIPATSTGTTKAVVFPTAGYFAYYCTVHGNDAAGLAMVGVVWVQ
jgi:plastocyanin